MKILLFLMRRVLSLRYKINLNGIENLKHDGPILIMPNHVALIDPRIIISSLGEYLDISPVASEIYYNKPILNQVMRLIGTIPVGEMSAGADAGEVKKVFSNIVESLNKGKNILIYPSGQIYRQGFESIKGKQAAYNISKLMPNNTKVIGIKEDGLWGSIWSMAWDNGKTGFFGIYIKCICYIFANLIFFVPKRKVNIDIFDITNEIKKERNKSLNEFNKYLENFYNSKGEEKVNFIKHYFYYNDVKDKKEPELISGSEKELNMVNNHDLSEVPIEVKQNILKKVSEIKEISISKINDDSNLILELYFDSLDLAEIKSYIQANFAGASNPPINDLKSIGDLYIMAIGKSTNIEKLKDCEWIKSNFNKNNLIENIGDEDNILKLWKNNFKNSKSDSFLWDNVFGMQSKKDFIIKSYLISDYLKKIQGEYIGIMLPSVGSVSLLITATYLAGKIPVMFNWTLGKESYNHCVSYSKVSKILTSSNFFDKVQTDFLVEHKYQNKFIFLEDLLSNVTIFEKIKALIKSFYMPIPKQKEEAVVLFTSGSESLPKAVSLTHKNLIEDIRGSTSIFSIKNDDILLGFLPPFHSFGFTINTIMPIITGLQVVYTPDPNDAKTILEIIKHTKVTSITTTPTFLKMIMFLAQNDDLKNIRYCIVGAEKCSDEVFKKFSELSPNGKILEGYGITECSPVISINTIEWSKKGTVGKLITTLECKILDVDTSKECSTGKQGVIYVSGPTIFNGYLDKKLESPFKNIGGKKYYNTGDLGFLDDDGFLTITGRLKRFIKIAGEMISLPFIEGVLLKKYNTGDELQIAIEAQEKNGEAKIVLFSIYDINLDEVNNYLRENGVSNLVKINEIIKIDKIPVLGTGKTDYKVLKKMISL